MGQSKQTSFFKNDWKYRFAAGGILRKKRRGRGQRPLSTKEPLHLVFKANRSRLKSKSLRSHQNFALGQAIIKTYAKKFFTKLEQISIQSNHIHLIIRTTRRSNFQSFFRVVAGQIAQRFEQEGFLRVNDTPSLTETDVEGLRHGKKSGLKLWLHRPFTRVIRGYKAFLIAMDYIKLNEKEARGEIRYNERRLRGLSMSEWEILWR